MTWKFITRFIVLAFGLGGIARANPPSTPGLHPQARVKYQKEDLSSCKLRHSEIALPARGSPQAVESGALLRLSNASLSVDPIQKLNRYPESTQELLDAITKVGVGDVFYGETNATLHVSSGAISDLGSHFLYEFDRKQLAAPTQHVGNGVSKSGATQVVGVFENAQQGHVYHLSTLDKGHALLRVVHVDGPGRSLLVQFVYQPDPNLTFEIPKGQVVAKYYPRRDWQEMIELPLPAVPGKVSDFQSQVIAERKFAQLLMELVKAEPKLAAERTRRAEAVIALGRFRVAEAADLLAEHINVPSAGTVVMGERLIENGYPAVAALVSIGKPGSLAALRAIQSLEIDGAGQTREQMQGQLGRSPEILRLYLLCRVLQQVEGRETARWMIKRKLIEPGRASASGLKASLILIPD